MANWTGGFEIADLESTHDDTSLAVLLQMKDDHSYGRYFRANMAIDQEKPGQPITKLDLFPVTTPLKMIPKNDPNWEVYEKALQPLTLSRKEVLLQEITRVLGEQYVYPEQAQEMISILFDNLKNGKYDTIASNDEFALRLVRDIMNGAENRFGGMYIVFIEPSYLRPSSDEQEKKHLLEMQKYIEEVGYGFGNITFDTEAIEGKTVATLPMTHFFELDQPGMLDAAAEKMNSVADADVLILDLRNCFGRSAETAAFVMSYLFDEPKGLTRSIDRNGIVQNSTSTLPIDKLPKDAKIFGGQKPVYVLTNNRTMHEAEMAAYSLQAYGRAVVVGETAATEGWGHPREERFEIGEQVFGKGWWSMYVETLRFVHDATGTDWDQVGVKSDVMVDETVVEEHCHHKARLAAIAFEKEKIERNKEIERQDELKV